MGARPGCWPWGWFCVLDMALLLYALAACGFIVDMRYYCAVSTLTLVDALISYEDLRIQLALLGGMSFVALFDCIDQSNCLNYAPG